MRQPSLVPSGNIRGVSVDRSDWDVNTAVRLFASGCRAERRMAKRWLLKHRPELRTLLKEQAKR